MLKGKLQIKAWHGYHFPPDIYITDPARPKLHPEHLYQFEEMFCFLLLRSRFIKFLNHFIKSEVNATSLLLSFEGNCFLPQEQQKAVSKVFEHTAKDGFALLEKYHYTNFCLRNCCWTSVLERVVQEQVSEDQIKTYLYHDSVPQL